MKKKDILLLARLYMDRKLALLILQLDAHTNFVYLPPPLHAMMTMTMILVCLDETFHRGKMRTKFLIIL